MTSFLSRIAPLAVAATLAVSGVAFAQSAPTLGDQLSSGQLSESAFDNLVSGAGVTADEARGLTLSELVRIKWADE